MVRLLLLFLSVTALSYGQAPKIIPVDSLGYPIKVDTSLWMSEYCQEILRSWRLNYKRPELFTEVKGIECFKDNPKLESVFTCAFNQLQSCDGEFRTFLMVNKLFTSRDSVDLQKTFPGMNIPATNSQHIWSIRATVLFSKNMDASVNGKNASFDWKQYVTYYPDALAKEKFNADTAITYNFDLGPKEIYKNKYRHVRMLWLLKRDRGWVGVYCIYTPKAKKHLPGYWKAAEQIFKYDD